MEGHIAVANDKLVEGLKFAVPDVASYVNSRESVTFWPSGAASYSTPNGVRLLKFHLNGDNWLDCKTLKLFFTVKNEGTFKLSPRHPGAYIWFKRARVIVGGQTIQDTDFFNRTSHMFHLLKSAERRLNDYAMSFGVYSEASGLSIDNSKLGVASDLLAGESITVGFSPYILGLFNQQSFLPLRYAGGVQLEFELVSNPTDAVKGNIAGQTATQSESFTINNAQIKCDVISIDNTVDNRFTEILMSGRHLPIHYTSVVTGSQIIRDIKTDVHVSRSLTRLKAIFVTLLKTTPGATGTNGYNGSPEAEDFWHPMGEGTAFDHTKELEMQIQIGSKLFPTYPIRSLSESFSHLHKTMGLHFSSGALNIQRASYRKNCFIAAIDLERMVGVGFSGLNTQDGQLLSIKLNYANNQINLDIANSTYTLYYSLIYDAVINIKYSGVDAYE